MSLAPPQLKDPDTTTQYTINWADWLGVDTISTSVWSVIPASGLTIVSDVKTTTTTTVKISVGTRGQVYRLTNRVTTVAGLTEDRSLIIRIDHR